MKSLLLLLVITAVHFEIEGTYRVYDAPSRETIRSRLINVGLQDFLEISKLDEKLSKLGITYYTEKSGAPGSYQSPMVPLAFIKTVRNAVKKYVESCKSRKEAISIDLSERFVLEILFLPEVEEYFFQKDFLENSDDDGL